MPGDKIFEGPPPVSRYVARLLLPRLGCSYGPGGLNLTARARFFPLFLQGKAGPSRKKADLAGKNAVRFCSPGA